MSTATVQDEMLRDVRIENGEGGLVTIQIEVAPEAVASARQSALKDYARRLKIPGFRPGHAPANIVRRQVGDETIFQAVSDKLVNDAYQKAIEQNAIRPLTQAQVSNLELDAFDNEAPMKFEAQVIARPQIEFGELEGVAATRPKVEITDEDVETGLEALRNENASLQTITDRGAMDGDVLNAELQVFDENGAPKGEEPAQLRQFILGQSGFVPAIDEHLIGAKLDEERRFPVTYPEDFQDEELAGKTVEFAVKVTALKERVLPELDDDFAKRVNVENVEAMRERMRLMLQITRGREAENFAREQVAQKVIDDAQFEIPTALVDRRLQERIHQLEHELEHQQKTLEAYLEENNQSREEMETQLREEISVALRRELVLDEIAGREELKITEDEFEQYYVSMAQALNQPVETLIERLDAGAIHASLLRRKAVDWLYERANVEETDAIANAE
jgi:trigger factor